MALTHFSGPVVSAGIPLIGSGPILTTGNVFFVDSGSSTRADTANNGSDPATPFSTVDFAIGRCTASNGDHILAMPGHSETITTDGGIAADVAGVTIIGLGRGTDRPVIILDAAAAAITMSAANVSWKNFEVRASFADVTNAFDVTAAWALFEEVEFTEEGADLNFVDYIHCSSTVDNTADGLRVVNCVGTAIDAAQNSFILTAADIDRPYIVGNWYSSDHANTLAMFEITSPKTITDILMLYNYMYTGATGDVGGIVNGNATDNTGIVAHNRLGHHDIAAEVLVDLDGVRQFDNLGTATDTASGFILPAIDS